MTPSPTPDPSAPASSSAEPSDPPRVGIRLVTVHDDTTRRIDLQLVGLRGMAVEDGLTTTFEATHLWPTVRDLLPPLPQLTADPAGRRTTVPVQVPGPGWDQQCRAMVSLAVVATAGDADDGRAEQDPDPVVVRTWFATEDGSLWSATPRPDGSTDIRLEPTGAVADLLVWDVTGALEALVARVAS